MESTIILSFFFALTLSGSAFAENSNDPSRDINVTSTGVKMKNAGDAPSDAYRAMLEDSPRWQAQAGFSPTVTEDESRAAIMDDRQLMQIEQKVRDEWSKRNLSEAARYVSLGTESGRLFLRGTVQSMKDRTDLEQAARMAAGKVPVRNEMTVSK